MIGSTIAVMVSGVEQRAPLTVSTIIAFERQYGTSWTATLAGDSPRMEYEMWIGWEATRAAGLHALPFDEWCAKVESRVNIVEFRDGSGPLVPAASQESPQGSPSSRANRSRKSAS